MRERVNPMTAILYTLYAVDIQHVLFVRKSFMRHAAAICTYLLLSNALAFIFRDN